MSVTGSPDSGPVKVGAPVLDVGAGMSCALGLLAAHIERLRTGEGRHVCSSLLEFALVGLGTLAASSFVSGDVPGLLGTHSPTFAPYGGFRTADGWIVLAGAGSEDLWVRCCHVLGLDDLPADPRFADNAARVQHRDELTERFERVLGTRTSAEWLRELEAEGVPVDRAPVDKDESDTEMALRTALERGPGTVVMLGALGGPRLDHALANLALLLLPELRGIDVRVVAVDARIRLLDAGDRPASVELSGRVGDLVTLLPVGSDASGVMTSGLAFPLDRERLLLGRSRGLSNRRTEPTATISLEAGRLLVVETPATL